MRAIHGLLLSAALLLGGSGSAAGQNVLLYPFGPGGEQEPDYAHYVTEGTDAETELTTIWPLVPSLDSSADTSLTQTVHETPSTPRRGLAPTFVYEGGSGTLELDGVSPIVLTFWADTVDPLACGLFAQILDGDGNPLGPVGEKGVEGQEPTAYPTDDTVQPLEFVFEGIAGSFDYLEVQVSQWYVDCAHRTTWHWGSEEHASVLAIPLGGGHGGNDTVTYVDLTEDEVTLRHTRTATNHTFIHAWSSSATDVVLSYNVTVDSGAVRLYVEEPDGIVVLDEELTETGTDSMDLNGMGAGDWNITLDYSDFSGTVRLDIDEPTATETGTGTQTGTTTLTGTGPATQTGTGTTDTETDNESPGIGVILAVGLLAVAALAVRRRIS